jgi:hypothetical protein
MTKYANRNGIDFAVGAACFAIQVVFTYKFKEEEILPILINNYNDVVFREKVLSSDFGSKANRQFQLRDISPRALIGCAVAIIGTSYLNPVLEDIVCTARYIRPTLCSKTIGRQFMEFELQNILIANDLCSTVADLLKLVKNSNKEIIQTAIYNVNADELVFRYVELQLLNKYPDLEKDLQIARAGKCMNTCC